MLTGRLFRLAGVVLALAPLVVVGSCASAGTAFDCPVTVAPQPAFVPPDDTPAAPPGDHFWYGSSALWTALPADGVWTQLPKDAHGYTQKSFWWREGYVASEETQPGLTVSGRRLDGTATFRTEGPATHGVNLRSGQFMLAGITIPEAGCWEMTGQYNDQLLSYVIEVMP